MSPRRPDLPPGWSWVGSEFASVSAATEEISARGVQATLTGGSDAVVSERAWQVWIRSAPSDQVRLLRAEYAARAVNPAAHHYTDYWKTVVERVLAAVLPERGERDDAGDGAQRAES